MTPSVTSVESSEQFWSKIRQIWRICEPCTNDENLSFDFLCLYKPSTTLSSIKLVNVKDSSSPIVSQLYEKSKWQQNNDQEQTSQYGQRWVQYAPLLNTIIYKCKDAWGFSFPIKFYVRFRNLAMGSLTHPPPPPPKKNTTYKSRLISKNDFLLTNLKCVYFTFLWTFSSTKPDQGL